MAGTTGCGEVENRKGKIENWKFESRSRAAALQKEAWLPSWGAACCAPTREAATRFGSGCKRTGIGRVRSEERFLTSAGRHFRRSENGGKSRPAPFEMTGSAAGFGAGGISGRRFLQDAVRPKIETRNPKLARKSAGLKPGLYRVANGKIEIGGGSARTRLATSSLHASLRGSTLRSFRPCMR